MALCSPDVDRLVRILIDDSPQELLYLSAMTVSNLVAIGCMARFVQLSEAGVAWNAFIAITLLALTFFRQKEAWLVWNKILPGMPRLTAVV